MKRAGETQQQWCSTYTIPKETQGEDYIPAEL